MRFIKNIMARLYWKPGNMLYPAPAVMVSCGDFDGVHNVFTAAWSGNVCTNPAMVYVSIRKERYSYDLIKKSKEFVINLVNKPLTYACDFCGVRSGRDIDKFEHLGLNIIRSKEVKAPSIELSPVCLECRVEQIIPLGSHDMFIARVLCVSVDDAYLDESNRFDLNKNGLVAYSHGEYRLLGKILGKFGYSVCKK